MKNYVVQDINAIHNIPNYKFSGYYWQSDREKPEMLFEQVFPKEKFQDGANPFCIEALLYSEAEQVSVHIQYTGIYLVHAYDHKKLTGLEVEEKSYLPHKLDQVQKVTFRQVWEEEPLEQGSDMMTLKPSALIFSGFKY
jgi:CRISPR type III-associated protein (TIGR04423 family)